MCYLADTQIVLWTLSEPEKLSEPTKYILQNHKIFVSQISLFEIAIKQKIGKLPKLSLSINALVKQMEQDNFNFLPLTIAHLNTYHEIPLLEEHRDPFDRLLLAIALSEKMPIISADKNFIHYKNIVQLIEN